MISDADSDIAETIRMIDNDPSLSREEKQALRQQYVDERNHNVRNAQSLGLLDTEESNLARLEDRYSGLGRGETKDDIKTQLQAQLVKAGVPEYQVKEVFQRAKELELTDEQLVSLLNRLLQDYRQ